MWPSSAAVSGLQVIKTLTGSREQGLIKIKEISGMLSVDYSNPCGHFGLMILISNDLVMMHIYI